MADTPMGETVAPVALSNEPATTTAPVTDNSSADVEQAKREAEQARIRANQLQNELDKVKQAQAEAERQKLEEQNEFKSLYEKTQADLTALRDTQAAQERQAQLKTATDSVFKDYPAEVVDIAKTAGLSLSDDGEAAQTTLKATLDAIKEKVAPATPTVTSSNPTNPATPAGEPSTALGRPKSLGIDNGTVAINDQGNPRKAGEYISGLNAIKQMKQAAGINVQ